MNQTISELFSRKSVRSFLDKEIPDSDKQLILEAASQAPTAGNMQMYTILDITDQEIKDKLSVSCDNQPFIAKGKLVLVFLSDYQKWYDGFTYSDCDPRDLDVGDFLLSCCDALIAAQNAVVAAESLGIGSCYIGDIMERYEYHRELFNLPDYVFPIALVVFGYPTEQQIARNKPSRVDLIHLVHANTYRRMDKEELMEMWKDKVPATMSYDEYMQAFAKRKYNSDFSREMSRSVRCFLENFNR